MDTLMNKVSKYFIRVSTFIDFDAQFVVGGVLNFKTVVARIGSGKASGKIACEFNSEDIILKLLFDFGDFSLQYIFPFID